MIIKQQIRGGFKDTKKRLTLYATLQALLEINEYILSYIYFLKELSSYKNKKLSQSKFTLESTMKQWKKMNITVQTFPHPARQST